MDKIAAIAKKRELGIKSVLNPTGIKGYIFVEAGSRDDVSQAIYGISHIKGMVGDDIGMEGINHFLEQKKVEITIKEGDEVELIAGPFKGEKAKVTRVNKLKDEVVVELLEAVVPIPVRMKIDAVRIIKPSEDEEKEFGEE